jgi:hypothetical protein
VPIVTSEIANRVYAVVNVNTFENLDPSRLRKGIANFGGEDVESRLARRRANWIADVRIFGLQGTEASDVAPSVHVSTSKEESR